jgi:heat shock protein HslJ
MMNRLVLPLLLFPLAACATMPPAEPESYRALGTEPFWSITIANGRMTYNTPDGGFSVRAPRGQETGDGRIWETRRLKLQISHGECSDGMSDATYPQTVRATVDGRELRGCGGAPLAVRP